MAPKRQRGRLNRQQQKGMLAQGEAAGDPSSSLSPSNPRFGMKYKRGDGCTGENDKHKKQKAHTTVHGDLIDVFEEQFGDLYDSGQGVWSDFSKGVASMLSESVLAVSSFKGDKMVCSCSGIIILCKPLVTTLLTSASLVRSSHDESQIDHDLMVKVRNVHNQYWLGTVKHYDLDYDILLVDIQTPYLCVARLYHEVQLGPGSKVVAVGRVFNTKKLMAASGLVKDKRDISDQEECTISTCKISKVGIGGPLIDLDGNFHGMNFYGEEETPFLPTNIILECLKRFGLSRVGNRQGDYCTKGFRPLDPCGEDFMNELNVELATKLSQSVVSLAAFNGILIKYGQCTSVLTSASLVRYSVDESKINDDLQIEVCLPNGQCVKGVLQCCCLEYNIAVIKITEFTDLCAIQLERRSKVVAIGRIFAEGRLTATHGMITDKQSKLDCEAGIGGPLVDFSGNFVGMNFYDDDKTPFLPRNEIIMCLRRFRTKGTKAVGYIDENPRPNRWPVPEPYWSDTSDVKRLSLEEVMSRIPKFDWRSTF
uniref:Uncharacterized protein n=1 Tax=Oryza punctata TaxID=4537 RepID=A0A0E0K4E3_ORYPU